MTKKDNNNQTNPSSPIWWLVSAIASVFIGSKLVSGMETAPAVLISLSIFLVLGWALQKIFGANAPVVGETKLVAKAATAKKKATNPKNIQKTIDFRPLLGVRHPIFDPWVPQKKSVFEKILKNSYFPKNSCSRKPVF